MKNKMKMWRRLASKTFDGTTEIRNGRKIRNMMQQFNGQKAMMLPIHYALFKKAGVSTEKFDKALKSAHAELDEKKNDQVEDVEIIEGSLNAA